MTTLAGGTAASEWQFDSGAMLNTAVGKNVPINAGQTLTTKDLDVGGNNELSVYYEMTGGASSDLTIQVVPLKSDGVTPMSNITVPPVNSNGPTFGGGVVQYTAMYDVSAYKRVRITAKNSNAGAQTINEFSWRLSGN